MRLVHYDSQLDFLFGTLNGVGTVADVTADGEAEITTD